MAKYAAVYSYLKFMRAVFTLLKINYKMLSIVIFLAVFLTAVSGQQGACGQNERFYNSSLSPTCDWNCQDLSRTCRLTTDRAVAGCYCLLGYARNLQQQCMPISQCVMDCFANERPIWPESSGCEYTYPRATASHRLLTCYNIMERRCVCATGYFRNQRAQCIKE